MEESSSVQPGILIVSPRTGTVAKQKKDFLNFHQPQRQKCECQEHFRSVSKSRRSHSVPCSEGFSRHDANPQHHTVAAVVTSLGYKEEFVKETGNRYRERTKGRRRLAGQTGQENAAQRRREKKEGGVMRAEIRGGSRMSRIKVLTRFDSVVKTLGGPTKMSHILGDIGGKTGPQYGQAVRFWKKTSGKFPPKHFFSIQYWLLAMGCVASANLFAFQLSSGVDKKFSALWLDAVIAQLDQKRGNGGKRRK
jgi:hypothetical protein